jgi:hypothetical protein
MERRFRMPRNKLNEVEVSDSSVVKTKETMSKEKSLRINVKDRKITLLFSEEPNTEAEQFIKKSLVSAYLIKERWP